MINVWPVKSLWWNVGELLYVTAPTFSCQRHSVFKCSRIHVWIWLSLPRKNNLSKGKHEARQNLLPSPKASAMIYHSFRIFKLYFMNTFTCKSSFFLKAKENLWKNTDVRVVFKMLRKAYRKQYYRFWNQTAVAGSFILTAKIDIGRYTSCFFISAALRQTKATLNIMYSWSNWTPVFYFLIAAVNLSTWGSQNKQWFQFVSMWTDSFWHHYHLH